MAVVSGKEEDQGVRGGVRGGAGGAGSACQAECTASSGQP